MPNDFTVAPIDPDLSVNEIIRRWPATMGPLNDAGIDTCCGGAASLRDAASDAGVPIANLTTTLARVLASRGA